MTKSANSRTPTTMSRPCSWSGGRPAPSLRKRSRGRSLLSVRSGALGAVLLQLAAVGLSLRPTQLAALGQIPRPAQRVQPELGEAGRRDRHHRLEFDDAAAGAEKRVPSHSHSFDAGAAWGAFALQGSKLGWYAHAMAGFDIPRAFAELNFPAGYRVEAAVAVGRLGDKSILPESLQARETPTPASRLETLPSRAASANERGLRRPAAPARPAQGGDPRPS